jgi:hypothetical protein
VDNDLGARIQSREEAARQDSLLALANVGFEFMGLPKVIQIGATWAFSISTGRAPYIAFGRHSELWRSGPD